MLILTRRPRQVVMVGRDVQIMVLDIAGDRVRLGITAPRELKVLRQGTKPPPPRPPRHEIPARPFRGSAELLEAQGPLSRGRRRSHSRSHAAPASLSAG